MYAQFFGTFLLSHNVVTKDQLLSDVVITNLRKDLQIDPFVQIETTRGVGFSLIESI